MPCSPCYSAYSWLFLLFCIVASALPSSTAAQILASESFSYDLGELNGQNGGSGWGSPWTAVTSATEIVNPSPALIANNIDGGNRALQIIGNNNNVIFRTPSPTFDQDELYFGFLFRFDSGSIQDNDFASFFFDTEATSSHQDNPGIGLKANEGSGGTLDLVARVKQNANAVYSTNISVGQTYHVVGCLYRSVPGEGNVYDRFSLWVNPGFVDFLSPDATSADASGSFTQFTFFGMRSVNLDAGDVLLLDEVIVAGSWPDVMSATLPVELTRFDALRDGSDVLLNWETASELNNAGFEVQLRSVSAEQNLSSSWRVIDFVEGYGTTEMPQSYQYRMANLEPGRHLFRLKQIDYDGTFEYSPEVETFIEIRNSLFLQPPYPNPFSGQTHFTVSVAKAQNVDVSVYDMLGRQVAVVWAGRMEKQQVHRLAISLGNQPAGLYFLHVDGEHFAKTTPLHRIP